VVGGTVLEAGVMAPVPPFAPEKGTRQCNGPFPWAPQPPVHVYGALPVLGLNKVPLCLTPLAFACERVGHRCVRLRQGLAAVLADGAHVALPQPGGLGTCKRPLCPTCNIKRGQSCAQTWMQP
jgi:hypothetical protein